MESGCPFASSCYSVLAVSPSLPPLPTAAAAAFPWPSRVARKAGGERRQTAEGEEKRRAFAHAPRARAPLDLFFHLEFLHWKATAAVPMTEVTVRGREEACESRGSSLRPPSPPLNSPFHPRASEGEGKRKRASLIIVRIRLRGGKDRRTMTVAAVVS